MATLFTSFADTLLDLLFPPRCAGCGRRGALFCERCSAKLAPYPPDTTPPDLDGAAVAFLFDERLREALHLLKYRRQRRMALPLGDLLATHLKAHPQFAAALLPVPLHPRRLAERGFNQSEELARRVATRCRLPLLTNGLSRVRETGQQARLNRSERQVNMQEAFAWNAAAPPPERVLIVDDVLTTGATVGACARALREAGAREVYALALARSLPGGR